MSSAECGHACAKPITVNYWQCDLCEAVLAAYDEVHDQIGNYYSYGFNPRGYFPLYYMSDTCKTYAKGAQHWPDCPVYLPTLVALKGTEAKTVIDYMAGIGRRDPMDPLHIFTERMEFAGQRLAETGRACSTSTMVPPHVYPPPPLHPMGSCPMCSI